MALQGGCMCGAVRYEASGEPFNATLCHCVDCRRASGAPALAWFSVRGDALRWTRGMPARNASSPGVERLFCARCGTQLTWHGAGAADEIDVTLCSLDDPMPSSLPTTRSRPSRCAGCTWRTRYRVTPRHVLTASNVEPMIFTMPIFATQLQ
jgi:hypothetical protein